MKTRWLLNLALLALVTALAAFAWWRSQEQARDPRAPLTSLKPADIDRVIIARAPRESIVLERTASGWRLVEPVKGGRANGFAVDNLLRLATAPIETTLTAPIELARYGLAPPAASVRLNDVAIDIGQMHPLNAWHYVRVGEAVHLIGSRYYAQVVAPYNNYLDSRLIEEGRTLVALRLPGFRLQSENGSWRRVPEDKNLSSDRINDFVEEWRNARALQVERYSGRAVLERIELKFAASGGKTESLTLGVLAREPELVLYRADEGLEYHFPEETGKRLLMLRDTTSPSLPRNAGGEPGKGKRSGGPFARRAGNHGRLPWTFLRRRKRSRKG